MTFRAPFGNHSRDAPRKRRDFSAGGLAGAAIATLVVFVGWIAGHPLTESLWWSLGSIVTGAIIGNLVARLLKWIGK
jgi:hypothetical protein